MKTIYQRAVLVALATLFVLPVLFTAFPQTAQAAGSGSFIVDDLLTEAKLKNKYMWLRVCMNEIDIDKITQDEMDAWNFFDNAQSDEVRFQIVGNIYGPEDDAVWSCHSGDNVRNALTDLGFTNAREFFCGLRGSYAVETDNFNDDIRDFEQCVTRSMNGGDHWDNNASKDEVMQSFEALIKAPKAGVGGSGTNAQVAGTLSLEADYVRHYLSFQNQCGLGSDKIVIEKNTYSAGDADGDSRYQLPVVDKNSNGTVTMKLASGQASSGSEVAIFAGVNDDEWSEYRSEQDGDTGKDYFARGDVVSCNEVAQRLRGEGSGSYTGKNLAQAYADYLKANKDKTGQDAGNVTTTSNQNGKSSADSCEELGFSLGWLFCQILGAIDGAISGLDKGINYMLYIQEDTYNSPNVRESWAIIRNIAFLILIPMMLLMVIGTAIGVGPFDAYTVKKALPRMVLAVIFIAISLPLTQFAIQVSNTIGQGAGNLILAASSNPIDSLETLLNQHSSGSKGFVGVLIATGATASAAAISFGVILSMAGTVALALLLGFVILVMRQVLLLLLIVIAPLAILVWIFPGNDKLWTVWKTTFIAMTVMYPIIAILIASGKFLAGVVG